MALSRVGHRRRSGRRRSRPLQPDAASIDDLHIDLRHVGQTYHLILLELVCWMAPSLSTTAGHDPARPHNAEPVIWASCVVKYQ
jgi:hypothetical protein